MFRRQKTIRLTQQARRIKKREDTSEPHAVLVQLYWWIEKRRPGFIAEYNARVLADRSMFVNEGKVWRGRHRDRHEVQFSRWYKEYVSRGDSLRLDVAEEEDDIQSRLEMYDWYECDDDRCDDLWWDHPCVVDDKYQWSSLRRRRFPRTLRSGL